MGLASQLGFARNTAASGESGRVGECSKMLREGDLVKLEEEICWASGHKGTAHAVAGNGFVSLLPDFVKLQYLRLVP